MVKITPLTGRAVLFVFSHRRQLDFGSVLGSNGQIMLPDDVILHVLHAHVRAEAITDFPLQSLHHITSLVAIYKP